MSVLVAALAVLAIAAPACGVGKGEPVASDVDDKESVVRELGGVKERMDQVDLAVHAIAPARPITRASARRWAAEVKKELRRYRPIRIDALALHDDLRNADDADLRRAAALLVRIIDLRHRETASFLRAVERKPFHPQLVAVFSIVSEEVKRTDEAWRRLAERLSERYATV